MKKTIYGILVLLAMLISAPAQADTLYFAAQAGFSTQPTSDNEDPNNPGNNFELNTQNGINGALAVGAKFGSLRAELEAVYRYNPNDKFVDAGGAEGADGSMSTAQIFLNGYYEIDIFGVVTPYVGVGVGYGTVSLNLKELDGTVVVDDDDTVYSYQLMAGAAVNVTENFSLTAEYRYYNTINDAQLNLSGGIDFVENSDISAHEVRFGIRYWLF
jgi:opacity protein-like surface antigen